MEVGAGMVVTGRAVGGQSKGQGLEVWRGWQKAHLGGTPLTEPTPPPKDISAESLETRDSPGLQL